jgi:O-antigen/teichoic acid export membrane protein
MSKSILERFVPIFSSRVIGILITFLATPVIVRLLGSERYGEYAFLLSLLSILMLFANGGIYDGIRKYLKESDRPEDWSDNVFAYYSQVGFALAFGVTILLLVAVMTGVVERVFGPDLELLIVLVGLVVVTKQAFGISRSTLMGFDREDISERYRVYKQVGGVGIGLVLLVLGYGVAGLLAGMAVANVLTAIAGFVRIATYIDYSHLFERVPDEFPRGALLKYNALSVVLFGLYVSIKHADIVLIQLYRTSAETGYYKGALTLAEFVWFVPRIVQMTLLHSTSELWSKGQTERITAISSTVTRYSMLFTGLLIIGLGVLAEPTVTLYYGEEFKPAVLPLLILLPGAMGFAVARPILAIGQGKGDFRLLIYATAGAATVNLALNLLLIPRMGIVGAAIATSVGYFSMFLFHVASARAIGFNPVADLRLPNVILTGIVAAPVIYFLATRIDSLVVLFAVVPPVGFVVYMGVAFAVGAVTVSELREQLSV